MYAIRSYYVCSDEPQLNATCGVARLLSGDDKTLEPKNLVRAARGDTKFSYNFV